MSFRQLSRLQSISEIFTIYFHVFYWIHLKVFFEIKWNTFFLLDFPFCVSESLYNSELFTFVVTVVILLIAVITQHSTARQIVSNWESREQRFYSLHVWPRVTSYWDYDGLGQCSGGVYGNCKFMSCNLGIVQHKFSLNGE